METLTIPAQPLKAVSLCKSRDDSRRVLCGILVQPTAEGLVLAATDSYTLATVECDGWKCDETVLIGEDFAKSLPKSARAVQFDFGSMTATVFDGKGREGKTHHFEVIEGNYPKFADLLPGDDANEGFAGFLAPGYIERAGKFHGIATGKAAQFYAAHDMKPLSTASESEGIRAVCLVMPVRMDGGILPERSVRKGEADLKSEIRDLKKQLREKDSALREQRRISMKLSNELTEVKGLEVVESPKKAEGDSPSKERKAKKAKEIPAEFAEVAEKLSSAGSEVKFSGCNLWATHVDGFDFEAEGFRQCKKETSKHCGQWFKKAA